MKMPLGFDDRPPLHLIWICDCSGSMAADGKIQSLNTAIRESLPLIRQVADENPYSRVFIRVLKFSSGAEWINKDPVPLENFLWFDLNASLTDRDVGAGFYLMSLKK